MKVRFRFQEGRRVSRRRGKNRRLAAAVAALLIPIALMAYVMALWKLASDLGLASDFGIDGLFSHWQAWSALAVALTSASIWLNRYGRGGELEESRVLTPFPLQRLRQKLDSGRMPQARRKSRSGS
jgi:hypothetical protein